MRFNPFELDNRSSYLKWRDKKLQAYDNSALGNKFVNIVGDQVSGNELSAIVSACSSYNYCIYRLTDPAMGTKSFVRKLGLALGLRRLDGNLCSDEDNITSIQVKDAGYIPYTNKPLSWHTDGYYNKECATINAMLLHCVVAAQSGGENFLLDHEMAYIQLRDQNPDFIRAFMHPQVLTIPPNIENGKEIRAAQSGPVFSFNSLTWSLHMRYSARGRNVEWKDDVITQQARRCMVQLLTGDNPYVTRYRLAAGEGIIANNVLHNRSAFIDAAADVNKRLLYRARYYDRVMSPVIISA